MTPMFPLVEDEETPTERRQGPSRRCPAPCGSVGLQAGGSPDPYRLLRWGMRRSVHHTQSFVVMVANLEPKTTQSGDERSSRAGNWTPSRG